MDNQVKLPEKTKPVYNPLLKMDKIFVLVIFALCFLAIDFAAFGGMALGFTISYVLLFLISLIYIIKKGTKPTLFSIFCGVLSVIGSFSFTFISGSINICMFFLVMGLYIVYTTGAAGAFFSKEGSYKISFDWLKNVFVLPFAHMPIILGSAKAGTKKDKRFVGSLLGIALSIPVICIVIPLLVESDAAFNGLMNKLFDKIALYLIEAALAVILFPYAYSYLFSLRNKAVPGSYNEIKIKHFLPGYIAVPFLSAVSLCYVVYLFSQLAYFVSAFSYILPEDYEKTASSFAREGFYQMCIVSVINVVLIVFVFAFVKRNKKKVSVPIKVLSLFMSAFSVFLIISAMQKMLLNISIYGLSLNRILVFTLMLMLIVAFVCLVIHIFVPKFGYVQPIILICSALFIALTFSNVDAGIARYNIEGYKSGDIEYLDTDNILSLGNGAAEYVIDLHKNGDIDDFAFHEYVSLNMYDTVEISEEDFEKFPSEAKYIAPEKFTYYNYSKCKNSKLIVDYIHSAK